MYIERTFEASGCHKREERNDCELMSNPRKDCDKIKND